jgi:hypothetical protein
VQRLKTHVVEESKAGMHATRLGMLDHNYSILVDDPELLECFLNYPEVSPQEPFALDFDDIAI